MKKHDWLLGTTELTVLLATAILFLPLPAEAEKCLSYEPAVVEITGTIHEEVFPGRPNYESIERGDEADTYWILKTAKPFCVNADPKSDINDVTETVMNEVQLVFMRHDIDEYKLYKNLLSRSVMAKGSLYHAHTAHHWTKILLEVKSIVAITTK